MIKVVGGCILDSSIRWVGGAGDPLSGLSLRRCWYSGHTCNRFRMPVIKGLGCNSVPLKNTQLTEI